MKSKAKIDRIKELLEKVQDSYNQINSQEGKFLAFEKWVLSEKFTKGFSRSNMHNYTKYFDENILPKLQTDKNFNSDYKLNSDKKINHVNKFIEYCNDYVDHMRKSDFSDRCWYFYFLDIGSNLRDYPRLGRAVLKTYPNKRASLIVPETYTEKYLGTYDQLNENVFFFDLRMNKQKRRLHIKVFLRDSDDSLMVGSYSTFDGRISTGSFVLQQQTHISNTPTLVPLYLSSKENSNEFKKVSPSIKNYLSIKKRNYYKVPKNILSNTDELEDFLSGFVKPQTKDIEDRFLELENPIVFISSPQTTIKGTKKMIANKNNIVDKLKHDLQKNLKDLQFKDEHSEVDKMQPLDCLRLFEKTRFFILILTETKMASFALIQLGWAVEHCKHVFLIYKNDIISDRFRALDEINPNFQRKSFANLELEQNEIYRRIHKFIVDNRLD